MSGSLLVTLLLVVGTLQLQYAGASSIRVERIAMPLEAETASMSSLIEKVQQYLKVRGIIYKYKIYTLVATCKVL